MTGKEWRQLVAVVHQLPTEEALSDRLDQRLRVVMADGGTFFAVARVRGASPAREAAWVGFRQHDDGKVSPKAWGRYAFTANAGGDAVVLDADGRDLGVVRFVTVEILAGQGDRPLRLLRRDGRFIKRGTRRAPLRRAGRAP